MNNKNNKQRNNRTYKIRDQGLLPNENLVKETHISITTKMKTYITRIRPVSTYSVKAIIIIAGPIKVAKRT